MKKLVFILAAFIAVLVISASVVHAGFLGFGSEDSETVKTDDVTRLKTQTVESGTVSKPIESAVQQQIPQALSDIRAVVLGVQLTRNSEMKVTDATSQRVEATWVATDIFFFEKIAPLMGVTAQNLSSMEDKIIFTLSSAGADGAGGVDTVKWSLLTSAHQQEVNISNFDQEARDAFQSMYTLSYGHILKLRNSFISAINGGGMCQAGPFELYFDVDGQTIEAIPVVFGEFMVLQPVLSTDIKVRISSNSPFHNGISSDGLINVPQCSQ